MNRTFWPRWPLLSIALVAVGAAVELPTKPTPEYQSLMRANASLVDLSAGNSANALVGKETNIEVRVAPEPGAQTVRELFKAKDYDGVTKGAPALKANYEKLEAFWTEKKVGDAIGFARNGEKACDDLVAAAQAKSDIGVAKALIGVERSCRDCHTAHRVVMLTDTSFQIRISPNLF